MFHPSYSVDFSAALCASCFPYAPKLTPCPRGLALTVNFKSLNGRGGFNMIFQGLGKRVRLQCSCFSFLESDLSRSACEHAFSLPYLTHPHKRPYDKPASPERRDDMVIATTPKDGPSKGIGSITTTPAPADVHAMAPRSGECTFFSTRTKCGALLARFADAEPQSWIQVLILHALLGVVDGTFLFLQI